MIIPTGRFSHRRVSRLLPGLHQFSPLWCGPFWSLSFKGTELWLQWLLDSPSRVAGLQCSLHSCSLTDVAIEGMSGLLRCLNDRSTSRLPPKPHHAWFQPASWSTMSFTEGLNPHFWLSLLAVNPKHFRGVQITPFHSEVKQMLNSRPASGSICLPACITTGPEGLRLHHGQRVSLGSMYSPGGSAMVCRWPWHRLHLLRY